MRWTCPHCGVSLAVPDDKLGTGWSFSRCYKCAGYALIRRSDVNLIKVDRAPSGEPLILPEATEEPLLSQNATKQIAKYLQKKTLGVQNLPPTWAPKASRVELPEPLPNIPTAPLYYKFLPVAIGVTATLAVGSGVYWYLEGQTIQKMENQNNPKKSRSFNSPETLELKESESSSQVSSGNPADYKEYKESKDSVTLPASSPAHEPNPNSVQPSVSPLSVKVQVKNAKLHAGPGLEYPVVALANTRSRYVVTGWRDRWLKIELKSPLKEDTSSPGESVGTQMGQTVGQQFGQQFGWIRNDLVQISTGPLD